MRSFAIYYDTRELALVAAAELGYGLFITGRTILAAGAGQLFVLTVHDTTGYADWRLVREYHYEEDPS